MDSRKNRGKCRRSPRVSAIEPCAAGIRRGDARLDDTRWEVLYRRFEFEKETSSMEGIQFVVDAKGRKTSVLIDLKQHGDLLEDLNGHMRAQQRMDEPREFLQSVKQAIKRKSMTRPK